MSGISDFFRGLVNQLVTPRDSEAEKKAFLETTLPKGSAILYELQQDYINMVIDMQPNSTINPNADIEEVLAQLANTEITLEAGECYDHSVQVYSYLCSFEGKLDDFLERNPDCEFTVQEGLQLVGHLGWTRQNFELTASVLSEADLYASEITGRNVNTGRHLLLHFERIEYQALKAIATHVTPGEQLNFSAAMDDFYPAGVPNKNAILTAMIKGSDSDFKTRNPAL